ncbi:hypothetical protein [Clostridium senegalense]|uniref:hypothetical protein n=1 Tax=Clostridium senegalense TaxID=1465809 RepID=UPI000287DC9B|nr:hypothetical protein [Clostridium senegalense]
MQVVKYGIDDNVLTVGFKEDNFVVYSVIKYDKALSKNQLLQRAYMQCKDAIEYERTLEEHLITTEGTGEEFIPEIPICNKINLSLDKKHIEFKENQESETIEINVVATDQYGDNFYKENKLTTTYGSIENNILTIPKVDEDIEITVQAECEGLTTKEKIQVYSYKESVVKDEPIDEEKIAMAEAIIDLNSEITMLKQEINKMKEGK